MFETAVTATTATTVDREQRHWQQNGNTTTATIGRLCLSHASNVSLWYWTDGNVAASTRRFPLDSDRSLNHLHNRPQLRNARLSFVNAVCTPDKENDLWPPKSCKIRYMDLDSQVSQFSWTQINHSCDGQDWSRHTEKMAGTSILALMGTIWCESADDKLL